jgi:uncharacterized protein (TIGR03435 family)
VASIKSVQPIAQAVGVGIRIDGAQFSCSSFSLKDYIRTAYKLKSYQVIGPEWIAQERYAVNAKIPEGERDKVNEMLQTLLEQRFKLKFHHEQKEFQVYALVVAKGGINMKESEPDSGTPSSVSVNAEGSANGVHVDLGGGMYFGFANDKFQGRKLDMTRLADSLSIFADRPIVDMTGLKGHYDFTINLSEEDYRAMLIRSALNNGVNLPPQAIQYMQSVSGDSLFSSMQLLGLKLEPRKAPLDVMVIDSAEKTPTDN